MNIEIQSPHVHLNETLTAFVNDKVNHLNHFYNRIESANVCLKLDKSDTHENKVCEIRLAIPGNDLFAKRNAHSFESAVSETIDAIHKQLIKHKEMV